MMEFDSKVFLRNLPNKPGVYQMLGENDVILYIGKARNLKDRLSSYFQRNLSIKTHALMQQVKRIEVSITSENEALLLEQNLIKQYKPRYNILMRDDKSYPYLYLSTHQKFPRLDLYRGKKTKSNGKYFGPYPSVVAVRETLNLLQKLFRIRQCTDTFFQNRTRPCLQYQIKRCTAPCVGLISEQDYQQDVKNALLFLEGKNREIIELLSERMEICAHNLDFEQAAHYRDQIANLRRIQEKQYVSNIKGNIDVVAIAEMQDLFCIHVMTIRDGNLIANKNYFPTHTQYADKKEILTAFLSQHYVEQQNHIYFPEKIIVNLEISDSDWLSNAISTLCKKRVVIQTRVKGERSKWLQMAEVNAKQALTNQLSDQIKVNERLISLQQLLDLPGLPERMECFDISHSSGEATVASCVVFEHGIPNKNLYRRFNISGITKGDDYAAMRQVLLRRYKKLKVEQGKLPDVVFIDGGKGQLHQAQSVINELGLSGILLVGVAKGPERKPGFETLFIDDQKEPVHCDPSSKALHLIQSIRDEAHRFAITGHRQQRSKTRNISMLEQIEGIGAKRRRDLLRFFGGLNEIKSASVEEIANVPGISKALAKRIYQALHDE